MYVEVLIIMLPTFVELDLCEQFHAILKHLGHSTINSKSGYQLKPYAGISHIYHFRDFQNSKKSSKTLWLQSNKGQLNHSIPN